MKSQVKHRSPWKRLIQNKLSVVGLVLVIVLISVASLAPIIAPHDPTESNWGAIYLNPCKSYPLGTDGLGRDVLSRIIYGARTSLIVGSGATAIGLFLGVTLGLLAGFRGGWISQLVMRVADALLSLPSLVLMIVIAAVLVRRDLFLITCVIGFLGWPRIARVTRSKVLSLKEMDYVVACRAIGVSPVRTIFRHILPNAIGPIVVLATLDIGSAITTETSLSFLGLGDPRAPSWGNMVSEGLDAIMYSPWLALFPGIAIFLAVFAFNLVGDGLRDALDVEA